MRLREMAFALVGMAIGGAFVIALSVYGDMSLAELRGTPVPTRTQLPTRTLQPTRTCPALVYKMLPDAEGVEDGLAVAYDALLAANRIVMHMGGEIQWADPNLSSIRIWHEQVLMAINEAHAQVVTWQQLGRLTCDP